MWQIDWMIGLLPTWVFQFMTLAGVVLLLASRFLNGISVVGRYSLPAYLTGMVITATGLYYGGIRSSNEVWEQKIAAVKEQVKLAENKSREVNTVIQTQVVEKVKVVKERVYVNKQINANTVAQQVDSKCIVPESAVVLINSASQNEVARGPASTDGRASDVRASEVIETVVENYGRYNELREKVIGWQRWYLEQKKIFDEANR
jgi:hypothetical protein